MNSVARMKMDDDSELGRIPIRVQQERKKFLRNIVLGIVKLPEIELIKPLKLQKFICLTMNFIK